MKVELKGWISFGKFEFESGPGRFDFMMYKPSGKEFVPVMEHTVSVELPDDFDPRAKQVEILEGERERITAAFQARITELNGQIQSLLAIEA